MKSSPLVRQMTARAVIAMLIAGVSAGCASNRVENSWKSSEFSGRSFKKVLVIGVAKRADVRQLYENEFVKQLEGAGAAGVASHTMLSDAQMTDRAAIGQAVARCGADAVLVTRLVKLEKKAEVVQPDVRLEEYVADAMPGAYTPTDLGEVGIATLQARLFDAASARPVWSATIQVSAGALKPAVNDVSRTIVKELRSQKLL